MCEYCGCQSLTSIDELTREHDLVVTMIAEVREARRDGDPRRMAATARRIAAVLGPHTEVEEHGLFPALAADFPDQIAALEDEHRRIEAVLAEAGDPDAGEGPDGPGAPVPADPSWPQRLEEALAVLRDHILKEQDGVFPAALALLGTEEWEAVEAVRGRVGTRLPAT
ncbi:hemerythrin domain-containing protein [Streptomyces sp. WAC 00631]|uniref:hemerythrin domain-containing protein n=1 Tax=Streptomyces sp. WAC 00631 TaxID=2203201 RepID=UPI000F7A1333|nr:hemerythrin domain-containing protein [Streptomyces sp. WAC 00631]MCC5036984.1 hemerythrin domain-containing protein [Streptomyces sp. WAC 00631]